MAGDDESRARHVLADMQLRISQGPTSALGIGEIVTPEEVRSAFLQLTKQFHPARFGRMSPELQRMSNEVFLGIKAAHDHMLRSLGGTPRGSTSVRHPTGAIPVIAPEGTNRTTLASSDPRASQAMPRVVGTSPPATTRASTPAIGRTPSPQPARSATPSSGIPQQQAQRPTTGGMPRISNPAATPPSTAVPPGTLPGHGAPVRGSSPSTGAGAPESSTRFKTLPPGASQAPTQAPAGGTASTATRFKTLPPGTQPGVTPASASSSSQRIPRMGPSGAPTSPPTTPPATPPTNPPTGRGPVLPPRAGGDGFNPPTVRNVAPPTPSASQSMPRFGSPPPGAEPFDEAAAFRDAASLMERKEWTAARQALHALAAKVPQSKTYRAWLCYARGREAFLAGRPDDAVLEMQRALQLEPDLAHAKHALAELQRRR